MALYYVYVRACWRYAHYDEFDYSDIPRYCFRAGASLVARCIGLFGG